MPPNGPARWYMLRPVESRSGRTLTRNVWVLGAAALGLGLGFARARALRQDLQQPRSLATSAYVGSQTCRACHPQHYQSFRRTYHRTMTQEASPTSVLAPFDGTSFDYLGVRAQMHRGPTGQFVMSFSADGGHRRWQAQVERTVGSHRYQQYLARDGDIYFRLPIAWDVARKRFIHMNGAFLTPDPELGPTGSVVRADYDRHVTRWNDNCVFCHNVHPNPGLDLETGRFATRVAELGVACEACHGPGGEHAARNRDPIRRYALHETGAADPTIRNPARMPAARSAEVCGRCHGQRITSDIDRVLQHGDPFIPGDPLQQQSRPLTRTTRQNGRAGLFAPRFWADGTPRLTAYEFQGYLQSPCRAADTFSCESCHAMHAGDPSGQLRPGREGDAMCTQCHRALAQPQAAARHSAHLPDSPGSRCRNCHMPPLVYGLVSVHLSHRIEIPRPAEQARAGRPDACTLCHVDRSRSWAAGALGESKSGLSAPQWSEVADRLLAGDPIERAVAATALGESDAHYAPSFESRLIGLLCDTLVSDAYPAVRAIAARSLRRVLARRHPEQAHRLDDYNATGTASERLSSVRALLSALGSGAVDYPEAAARTRLREQAARVAIEIGE